MPGMDSHRFAGLQVVGHDFSIQLNGLECTEKAAAAKLRAGPELDRPAHPGKLSGHGDHTFTGLKLQFENGQRCSKDAMIHVCFPGILYPLGPWIVFPSLSFYWITCSSSHSGFA